MPITVWDECYFWWCRWRNVPQQERPGTRASIKESSLTGLLNRRTLPVIFLGLGALPCFAGVEQQDVVQERGMAVENAVLGGYAEKTSSVISLEDAYLLALGQHPSIRIRKSGIEAAKADVDAAEWKRFPSAGIDFSNALQQSETDGGDSGSRGATFRIQQPLWSGGRIGAEIDSAKMRHEVATLSKDEVEIDLLLQVAQAFVDRFRFHERVVIANQNLIEHQRLLDLIQRRAMQNVSSQADLALGQARLQQAHSDLQSLTLALRKAHVTLEKLLGTPLDENVLAQPHAIAAPWHSREEAIQDAERYSPYLRRLRSEVALAHSEAAEKKTAFFPQVSLRYEKFNGYEKTIASDRLMLVLEYQPGAGLSSLSAAEAAEKRIAMAEGGVEFGARDVVERVTEQFNEISIFSEQRKTSRQYAEATKDVMSSYLRQFTAGRKSWLDVLNVQREVAQSAFAAIDADAGEVLATHRLAILTGRTSIASLNKDRR